MNLTACAKSLLLCPSEPARLSCHDPNSHLATLGFSPTYSGTPFGEEQSLGRQIQPLIFPFLLHPELEIPGISVNATSVVEDIDSVAAICYTNDTNVMWYVNSAPVSSNNRMTISPDTKTLIIQRIERFDSPLQCSIEIIPEIFGRSELIQLTVACECYGVMGVKARVGSGYSEDLAMKQNRRAQHVPA